MKRVFTVVLVTLPMTVLFDSRTSHSANVSYTTPIPILLDIVDEIRPLCVRLTYWAFIIMAAGSAHVFCWKITSERQVSRLRSQLFNSILYQDCAWFDCHDTGSLSVTLTRWMIEWNFIILTSTTMQNNVFKYWNIHSIVIILWKRSKKNKL